MNQLTQACNNCGWLNTLAAQYCAGCGNRLRSNPQTPGSVTLRDLRQGDAVGQNNRYQIEKLISKGGQGQTYLAFDIQLRRRCVIKRPILNSNNAIDQQKTLSNFEQEALLLSELNTPGHPNIPEIYDYLPLDYCLVMKYIEGRNLEDVLIQEGGRIAEDKALLYIRSVCDALNYMHSRVPTPILHRDIKPSNIILDNQERIWLIDFGLSKASPISKLTLTSGTQGAGTCGYTPVEQWLGFAEASSDIYATSATLHELITGFPSPVEEKDVISLLSGQNNSLPILPPIRTILPSSSPILEQLIIKGLSSIPTDRPTSKEYIAILDSLIQPKKSHYFLQAPNGNELADAKALAIWSENNWPEAREWLFDRDILPEQIEKIWGQNQLARDTRAIVRTYSQKPDLGVDNFIALLDPIDFGSERTLISADKVAIDFGKLSAQGSSVRHLTLTNAGRRYIEIDINTPSWIVSQPSTVFMMPQAKSKVILRADVKKVRFGGLLQDKVSLLCKSRPLEVVSVNAYISLPRTVIRNYPIPVFAAAIIVALIIILLTNWSFREITMYWHYQNGVSAMQERRWNDAREAFSQIESYRADYRDIELLQADTNYYEAVDMINDKQWQRAAELIFQLETTGNHNNASEMAGTHREINIHLSLLRWQSAKIKLIHTASAVTLRPSSIVFSPDGTTLVSGNDNGSISLWDANKLALLQTISAHTSSVREVKFSRDGRILASVGKDGSLKLWDAKNWTLYRDIDTGYIDIYALAIDPSGQIIATGGVNQTVNLWNINTGESVGTLNGHTGTIRSIAFSSDGQLIASGSADTTVNIWRVSDNSLVNTLEAHTDTVHSVIFSSDGLYLISGSYDKTIKAWKVTDYSLAFDIRGHSGPVWDTILSIEGQTLVSASGDGSIRLWRISDSALIQTLSESNSAIIRLAFSPYGQSLISIGSDDAIRLWKPQE